MAGSLGDCHPPSLIRVDAVTRVGFRLVVTAG